MKRTLHNQVILITGGTRGLGLEIARLCLAQGATVAIAARQQAGITRALKTLNQPARTSGHIADIGDETAADRLISEVIARWGRLDILINNAAQCISGPMTATKVTDYRQLLMVNTMGTIALTEAALPHLKTTGRGGIITIASAAGIMPIPHLAAYNVSKAALQHYMQMLELEQGGKKLSTLTVYPSFMSTNFLDHTAFRGSAQADHQKINRLLHLPLLATTPQAGARRIIRAWTHGRQTLIYPWLPRLGAAWRWVMPQTLLRLFRWTTNLYFGRQSR